jgi:hypothetical protein
METSPSQCKRDRIDNLLSSESGQALSVWLVVILMVVSVFLGIAYDMSLAWMHKAAADAVAEAACTAGAMDLEYAAMNNVRTTPDPAQNFIPSSGSTASGDCKDQSSNPICYYASINGYQSSTTANDVTWALSTVPPANGLSSTFTTTSNGVAPYLNVTVTENVPVTFMGIFSRMFGGPSTWTSVQIAGHCNCGLQTGSTSTSSNNVGVLTSSADCEISGAGSCSVPAVPQYGASSSLIAGQTSSVTINYHLTTSASASLGTGTTEVTCNGGTSWNTAVTYSGAGPGTDTTGTLTYVCPTQPTNTNQIGIRSSLSATTASSSGYSAVLSAQGGIIVTTSNPTFFVATFQGS